MVALAALCNDSAKIRSLSNKSRASIWNWLSSPNVLVTLNASTFETEHVEVLNQSVGTPSRPTTTQSQRTQHIEEEEEESAVPSRQRTRLHILLGADENTRISKFESVEHPTDSPGLAPTNFHYFPFPKRMSRSAKIC